jgi:hypothetical protein
MNFFKRSTAAMSPLETTLLASLKSEPTKWFFAPMGVPGETVIRCDNREKGVSVYVDYNGSAWSGKLKFNDTFWSEWFDIAIPEHTSRVAEADRIESAKVESQMRQRMGL